MVDYYDALGVKENASNTEIKKSFRKLAQKHHPDIGGNEAKFKEINEAYDTLKDPEKKVEYDNMRNWQSRDRNFTSGFPLQEFSSSSLGAVFQQVFNEGFGLGHGQPTRSISIQLDITLNEVYTGAEKQLDLQLPNGQIRSVNVNIPAGIEHGTRIRYAGLGEVRHPTISIGDLILIINVLGKKDWERDRDDLITFVTIDCFDAITGCEVQITHLDGKTLRVKIPAGTQPGQRIRLYRKGILNPNTQNVGNLFLIVNIIIPRINVEQMPLIKEIKSLGSKSR